MAILAIGNATGRIVIGTLSDKFGRKRVLCGVFLFQALLMFLAIPGTALDTPYAIVLLATLIGFNYGANLAIFPSYTKDLWGMPHFGTNYGLLFTSWGVGGFAMSKLSETLKAHSGSFTLSFLTAGILLLIGFEIARRFEDRKDAARDETRKALRSGPPMQPVA